MGKSINNDEYEVFTLAAEAAAGPLFREYAKQEQLSGKYFLLPLLCLWRHASRAERNDAVAEAHRERHLKAPKAEPRARAS